MQSADFAGKLCVISGRVFALFVDFPAELTHGDEIADYIAETHFRYVYKRPVQKQ